MLIRIVSIFSLVIILAGCTHLPEKIAVSVDLNQQPATGEQPTSIATTSGQQSNTVPAAGQIETTATTLDIPRTINWPVTFASQAPLGVWDPINDEACEEASMIGAFHYYTGQSLTNEIMDQKIKALVAWQGEKGYRVDLSASETVTVLKDYFGVQARLVSEVTVDRIKYELAHNRLVLVPVAGRLLGNPYFQQPGPIYHMLIIRGYDDRDFITNDPGTRRGEGFHYRQSVIIDAIHDWNHALGNDGMTDSEIIQGAKVVVVVDGVDDAVVEAGANTGTEVVD